MESSRCPKCGDEPFFIEHVDKWYCYGCNTYIDEVSESVGREAGVDQALEPAVAAQELKAADDKAEVSASVKATECKNCGAELQNLKDGRQFCFVCETYQDEIKPEPEHIENEAQSLVNRAAVPTVPETKPEVGAPARVMVPEQTASLGASPSAPLPEVGRSEPFPAPPMPVQGPRERSVFVKMCYSCGQPMKFIDKYQRYYCYGCKKYGPKDEKFKGVAEKKSCPDCGRELRYIDKYNEHYCNTCKTYPLRARKVSPSKSELMTCPKCSEPLKWIEKYQRHYCYTCKEYTPKGGNGSAEAREKKPCPTCNEEMKYVSEYNEWYCFKCRKYSLRPNKPALLM